MELREQIVDVFADVPYPGDGNITGPCRCAECEEITEYFKGTSQSGHSVCDLRYHSAALSLFTDAARHYWLPSFMIAVLDDAEEADIIIDGLQYHFSPSNADRELLRRLSLKQLETIRLYFLDGPSNIIALLDREVEERR